MIYYKKSVLNSLLCLFDLPNFTFGVGSIFTKLLSSVLLNVVFCFQTLAGFRIYLICSAGLLKLKGEIGLIPLVIKETAYMIIP